MKSKKEMKISEWLAELAFMTLDRSTYYAKMEEKGVLEVSGHYFIGNQKYLNYHIVRDRAISDEIVHAEIATDKYYRSCYNIIAPYYYLKCGFENTFEEARQRTLKEISDCTGYDEEYIHSELLEVYLPYSILNN